jgi:hypothetical protein
VLLSHNPEEAEVSIVKFLIALTDERVAFRSAPFDQPEIPIADRKARSGMSS